MDEKMKKDTEELNDLISNAMEMADVITLQKILDQKNIKYDKDITKLDDLKSDVHKNCSDKKMDDILKEFNSYKAQSLDVVKNLDVNNLNKFKAEQTIKAIGRTASPIAQTLTKSALTIAMYQGLYLMPFPVKLGVAGGVFLTKRVPRMYRGAKSGLESLRNGGLKKVPKKVLATVIAGGIGVEAIVLLNYLAKGSIPGKILDALPGIKSCLNMVPTLNARKAVLLTTGVVKGVDAHRLKKEENKMFEPIIKGFFLAKGMEVEGEIKDFSDVKKYVEKLDDIGKYEFDQYLKKCVSMKKMINNKDSKVKKVGKAVLKLVSDAFETASYLALITPPVVGTGKNPEHDDSNNMQPEPEPARATAGEQVVSEVGQKQTETAGDMVMSDAKQVQPGIVKNHVSDVARRIEENAVTQTQDSISYNDIRPETIGKNGSFRLYDYDNDGSIVPGNAFEITPENTTEEALEKLNKAVESITKSQGISKGTDIVNAVPETEIQPSKDFAIPKELANLPKAEPTPEELAKISKDFTNVSPSVWDSFLSFCAEHKDEITAGTIIGGIGSAFMYFMESGGWALAL